MNRASPQWRLRLRGAAVLLPCAALLATALSLRPDGDLYGTHQRLGLAPCAMLSHTGYPCPTCGLTTSVTAAAHGQLGMAIRAHVLGPVLVAATWVLGAMGLGELASGRDLLRRLRPGLWWIWAVLAIGLMAWGINVAMGIWTGRYPTH